MTSMDTTLGMTTDAVPRAAAPPSALPANAMAGRTSRRIIGAIVALGCGAILFIGAWMTPAEHGLGTHQQLNMPPCGWILLMDIPCPTCGMTTAVTNAAHGHLLKSFLTQPAGFLFALATTMALFIGIYTAATGSRVAVVLGSMWTRRTTWWLIGIVALSWLYKIASYKGLV